MKNETQGIPTSAPAPRPPLKRTPALWIRPNPDTAGRCTVFRVDVLRTSEDGFAVVEVVENRQHTLKHVNISDLASTPEKAMERILSRLSAMLAGPALTAMPGMKASTADNLSPETAP
ncbi:hypothetical protein OPIT5_16635 [Opitutaceae bacterium TAV5]|nr:hypothetical protein OPIT5_16635 [Opitutaceae bacterium TAV5]